MEVYNSEVSVCVKDCVFEVWNCKFADIFSLFLMELELYLTVLATYDFLVHAVLCINNQINLQCLSFFSLALPRSLPNANNTVLTVILLYCTVSLSYFCLFRLHPLHYMLYHQCVWQDKISYLCFTFPYNSSNVHSKVLRNIVSLCSFTLATFYLLSFIKANINFFFFL